MPPNPEHPAAAASPGGGWIERAIDVCIRLGRAWGALSRERRYASLAALLLFLTLFLPWYQDTLAAGNPRHHLKATSQSVSGWGAFSLFEAGVLVLALAVLVLLFRSAEGRGPHLPGGDGTTVTLAGGLAVFLVVWRIFDHSGSATRGVYVLSTGVDWGIFVALLIAGGLTYAGTRIRTAPQPGPRPSNDEVAEFDGRWREPSHEGEPSHEERTHAPRGAAPATGPVPDPSSQPARRTAWLPAERPEWREPARPAGWLTAPPKWSEQSSPSEARTVAVGGVLANHQEVQADAGDHDETGDQKRP